MLEDFETGKQVPHAWHPWPPPRWCNKPDQEQGHVSWSMLFLTLVIGPTSFSTYWRKSRLSSTTNTNPNPPSPSLSITWYRSAVCFCWLKIGLAPLHTRVFLSVGGEWYHGTFKLLLPVFLLGKLRDLSRFERELLLLPQTVHYRVCFVAVQEVAKQNLQRAVKSCLLSVLLLLMMIVWNTSFPLLSWMRIAFGMILAVDLRSIPMTSSHLIAICYRWYERNKLAAVIKQIMPYLTLSPEEVSIETLQNAWSRGNQH